MDKILSSPKLTSTQAKVSNRLREQRKSHEAVVPRDWRIRVAAWCEKLATLLRGHEPPMGQQGVRLKFVRRGSNLGYPVYAVVSVRGELYMGRLEWSNQWRRPRFKADPEAVFDPQCLAEIFAMMKEFK